MKGRITLMTLVFINFNAYSQNRSDQILLPSNPPIIFPPREIENQEEKDYKNLIKNRLERDKKQNELHLTYDEIQKKKILENTTSPKKMDRFIHAIALTPKILVTGPRENYEIELGSQFQAMFRNSSLDPKTTEENTWETWWGLRTMGFSGYGVYDGVPGRFGLLYFGPVFGFGSVESKDVNRSQAKIHTSKPGLLNPQTGNIFSIGIMAQTKIGDVDISGESAPKDMSSRRGVEIDLPGVNISWDYSKIYYGTSALHLQLGMVMGEQKNIVWFGIGLGGWN